MGHPKRNEQFTKDEICVVHTTQRCVRRAYLVGRDKVGKKDYSHRRGWIKQRLQALASVLAVDVLAYSVMENHVHTLLRNRPDVVAKWSDRQVAVRWLRVFPGRRIDEELGVPTEADVQKLLSQPQKIAEIRGRLSDISWFMRALAEPIARRANKEDNCTGRFWQGRFKAQRILDDAGLLACAAYIELNPIRAGIAASIEDSHYTSVLDRLLAAAGDLIESAATESISAESAEAGERLRTTSTSEHQKPPHEIRYSGSRRLVPRDSWLAPLKFTMDVLSSDPEIHADGLRASNKGFLSLSWAEYEAMVRWTASERGSGKAKAFPADMVRLMNSVGIASSAWHDLVWNFKTHFGSGSRAGSTRSLLEAAKRDGKSWYRGVRAAAHCFST